MKTKAKIGFGGGCHWCTEAIFQSLKGVYDVHQGFICSIGDYSTWSEAVIVEYYPEDITMAHLIAVHLHTHKSTVLHSMRPKYRSAVYFFDSEEEKFINGILEELQDDFTERLITKTLPFSAFRPSEEQFKNYYYSNPKKPFCSTYISPKLKLLFNEFSSLVKKNTLKH